jgi:hypothetical protein
VFSGGEPGFVGYMTGMFSSALGMFTSLIFNWNWTSPAYWLLIYFVFCITSEITLSPPDLAGMWRGFFPIALFVILINLIPGFNVFAIKMSEWLAPTVFLVHSILLFVLFVDIGFYLIFRMIVKIFRRR